MNVEEYTKSNKTYNFLNKCAIQKMQNLIENNEEVLYSLVTNISIEKNNNTSFDNRNKVFGGAIQINDVLNGVIAITNKRIIFCNSTLGYTNQKQLLIKDITSIDEHISGLTKTGELRINGITETFIIKILKKGLEQKIKEAINKARNVSINEKNVTISCADEIRKYNQLYKDGIINQEEFEKKKQELLK